MSIFLVESTLHLPHSSLGRIVATEIKSKNNSRRMICLKKNAMNSLTQYFIEKILSVYLYVCNILSTKI